VTQCVVEPCALHEKVVRLVGGFLLVAVKKVEHFVQPCVGAERGEADRQQLGAMVTETVEHTIWSSVVSMGLVWSYLFWSDLILVWEKGGRGVKPIQRSLLSV